MGWEAVAQDLVLRAGTFIAAALAVRLVLKAWRAR